MDVPIEQSSTSWAVNQTNSPPTPKSTITQLPSLSSDSIPLFHNANSLSTPRHSHPTTLFSDSKTTPTSPQMASMLQSASSIGFSSPVIGPSASFYRAQHDSALMISLSGSIANRLGFGSELTPSGSSSGVTTSSNQGGNGLLPMAQEASSSSSHSGAAAGGTKEAWKRRKQVLLAEASDHTVANLHLHGLRPPPNTYLPYYQTSSIIGNEGVNNPIVQSRPDTTATNQATFASSRTAILRPDDPKLRNDIIRIVDQWLADEGFTATRKVLMDEAGIKQREREEAGMDARKLRGSLLEGDWPEVDKLLSKPLVKNHKAFLYAVYKQQFLEHIEHREFQKAFTFLNKRLKPLEHYQPHSSEFRDLCYLLSAKAVTDVPSFSSWEGIQPAREKLVLEFAAMLEQDRLERENGMPGSGAVNGSAGSASASSSRVDMKTESNEDGSGADSKCSHPMSNVVGNKGDYVYIPPRRLMTILHQAVAYQVEFARYHPKKAPVVSSLLHDYTGFVVPNSVLHTMRGHCKNVKSVRFVGEEGRKLVSGSSDNTVRLWDTNTGRCEGVLEGHRSRVWDVDSTRSGGLVASASGDSTVKVWEAESGRCQTTLRSGLGDVYSCRFHPDERHLVSAGYDKLVRMYDVETGSIVKTFTGHQLGVSSAIFNPLGNLIVTASKDTTIRFWDVVSGLCIRTITGHLGEVTSVEINENGSLLLSSSKDNSNRLWDVRMLRPLKRFKGHQNTSKNFIRSSFAHTSLLVGGSEDGLVYMWDQESSEVLQTLEGHGSVSAWSAAAANNNVAYGAVWNKAQSLLASCGDDGTVKTWVWDEKRDQEEVADLMRRGSVNQD